MNVTSVEAELLVIRIGLIPAMEDNDTHDIIVITDSISAASKTLKSHVNPRTVSYYSPPILPGKRQKECHPLLVLPQQSRVAQTQASR